MAPCAGCGHAAAVSGWLCEDCAATIHGVGRLSPEQIVSAVANPHAALIDRWGRPHALGARTMIGRQLEGKQLAVADVSVSRRHAEVVKKRDGTWWVIDLMSSNGTTVADEVVEAPRQLVPPCAIFFGEIGFFFVAPAPGDPPVPPSVHTTQRPAAPPARAAGEIEIVRVYDEDDDDMDSESGGYTFSGLRMVDLVLAAPTGGGGGVIELSGRTAQLTEVQYALVRLLAERMQIEEGHDERVRGFVRSTELLASLPWDTPRPEDNHIKQLVRRVRRTLVRANLGDLIESRQGFGYRLRVRLGRPLPPR